MYPVALLFLLLAAQSSGRRWVFSAAMYPVALLFLLLAAQSSESTATLPYNNTGMKFVVVFPENIASYHPSPPTNMIQITALLSGTKITIKEYNKDEKTYDMGAGEMNNFTLSSTLELNKQNISNQVLTINSTNDIAVQAISLKQNSVQTALIIPTNKLSTTYLIPPIPTITGTTDPQDLIVRTVTERGPFRLIIINGDLEQQNTVTVKGSQKEEVSLQPGQVAQIWLQNNNTFKSVQAEKPVAVLFGHPCAILYNCTCTLLYTILPPAPNNKLKYLIPPFPATNTEAKTVVLLGKNDSTSVVAYDSKSPVLEIIGTAILYLPGLLLPLIPEAKFGSCFVVTAIPNMQNYAMIVVQKSVTDKVHVGKDPISTAAWQDLQGTEYCSTNILLSLGKTVIWHASSTMAVYFIGGNKSTRFGNPAPVISTTPDDRGCTVIPEVIQVGEDARGWRESLQSCKDKELELISLSNETLQKRVYEELVQTSSFNNNSVPEVWIGMRRHSLNGEWYWVNGDPVTNTNWDQGEPGGVDDGQCAIMSMKKGKDFGWSDDDCCKDAHPVCYKEPTLLPT